MQWYEFIFSRDIKRTSLRHGLFWLTWLLYFTGLFYIYAHPTNAPGYNPAYVLLGSNLIIKSVLLVCLYVGVTYIYLYWLLPKYILKRKWLPVAGAGLALSVLSYYIAYNMFWEMFPVIDQVLGFNKPNSYNTRFWPAVTLGLLNPLKVVAAAALIKYLKYWWLKQTEKAQLEKEKINTELKLLKAQIHPSFLFRTLANIEKYASASSSLAPQILLKFSDLLSYMLYECDEKTVMLEKEILMMRSYVELESIRQDKLIEVEINVKGQLKDKKIPPFLLLPFIENSFKKSADMTEQSWIYLDIVIEKNHFSMKLVTGISANHTDLATVRDESLFKVQKRLALIYPGSHHIRITTEQEMMLVFLDFELEPVGVAENNQLFS